VGIALLRAIDGWSFRSRAANVRVLNTQLLTPRWQQAGLDWVFQRGVPQ